MFKTFRLITIMTLEYNAKEGMYIMKYPKEEYYSCYSPRLKDDLLSNGYDIYDEFTHLKTTNHCWVFERNDSLNKFLTQWSELKRKALDNKS